LLGMAVLTGREPKMANGIYTACGKSFAKHSNNAEFAWAVWFKNNEHVRGATVKAEQLKAEEAQRLIEAAKAAEEAKAKAEAPKAEVNQQEAA